MPPLTPEQLAEASARLDGLTEQFEKTVLEDICRRIAKAGTITDTAEWQMIRLKEMGYANDVIEKAIADYTEKSEAEIRQLFFEAGQVSDDFYEKVYSQAGKGFTPLEDNPYMQQYISAGIEQTKGELVNFTQSMGFAVRQADGTTAFLPVAKTYQSALDLAQMQVATGVFDYNTAVRNAVKSLTDSGLQFVDYASGHRNRADVAVRRAVLTGVSQMTGKISEHNSEELETDLVEVTAHAGARPDHAEWQGRWFSLSGKSKKYRSLVEATGYGTGAGLKGWNCRHDFYPVIEGISEPTHTEEQLANIDPPPIEYNGKALTYYECTQRQRQMETAMRKTKREIIGAKASGDDDMFTAKSILLRRQKEEYANFSKAAGLLTQNERTQVYGFDKSIAQKAAWKARKAHKPLDNGGGSGIMKARETTVVNAKSVVGQWEHRSNFDNDIDDIIDYQGFNGNPKIVYNRKDFDDCVEKDHFLAERTFCADTQEQLDLYDNQLKAINGENYFYVNCGVGGAQYGQGMYCAADYTKGTIPYADFEHEIKQYAWGDTHQYSKTNWMTLDPSAKILNVPDGYDRKQCNEYVYRLYEENYIQNRLSSDNTLKIQWEAYQKDMQEVRKLNGSSNPADWDKADILIEKTEAKYPAASEFHSEVVRLGNNYKDTGVMAAEMGYDAINAKGHGTTDSYTVVLNRTKLIIYGGDDYEYRKK